jgi:hypothetical protein
MMSMLLHDGQTGGLLVRLRSEMGEDVRTEQHFVVLFVDRSGDVDCLRRKACSNFEMRCLHVKMRDVSE